MAQLREKPITEVGGLSVECVEDYQSGKSVFSDGRVTDITLPTTNALKLYFDSGAWACIRPSGTEPKIKVYLAVRANTAEAAEQRLEILRSGIEKLM
jgi:phosphoglucomutase